MLKLKSCIFIVLLFLTNVAFGMTRSEMRTKVRELISDNSTDSTLYRWSNTQINEFLDIGEEIVFRNTYTTHEVSTITVTAGTTEYVLPNQCWAVVRVEFNAVMLEKTTLADLDSQERDWRYNILPSTPTKYYFRRNKIGLEPYPAMDGTLTLDYIHIYGGIGNDTDLPFNNRQKLRAFHNLIVWYTVYELLRAEGRIGLSDSYKADFKESLQRFRQVLGLEPAYVNPVPSGSPEE